MSKRTENMLRIAAEVAKLEKRGRTFLLGAVAYRKDGALIASPNGFPIIPNALSHAEARLCRKIDSADTVYIARVSRENGTWQMAKPCMQCVIFMRAKKIKRAIYTITEGEYGGMIL